MDGCVLQMKQKKEIGDILGTIKPASVNWEDWWLLLWGYLKKKISILIIL